MAVSLRSDVLAQIATETTTGHHHHMLFAAISLFSHCFHTFPLLVDTYSYSSVALRGRPQTQLISMTPT